MTATPTHAYAITTTHTSRPYVTNHKTALELGRDPDQDKSRRKDPFLDSRSEPHWITDRLISHVLTSIHMVADGAVMPLKVKTTSGKAGTITPTSDLAGILDGLRDRYLSCSTHRARLVVIRDAQAQHLALLYAPNRAAIQGTREWREAVGRTEGSFRKVAHQFSTNHMMVVRCRREFGG